LKNKIVVIPDAHARVGDDLSRFRALGKYIVKERPTDIISIGDFADMQSLSSFDSDLRKARITGDYQEEVSAVKTALDTLFSPLRKLQKNQRKNKKKVYNPNTVITLGNHEARYDRVIEQNPIILNGTISVDDLEYEKYFKTVVPFKELHFTAGVGFIHYLPNLMGRAIGGSINPARGILNHAKTSVIVGHSHLYDYAVATTANKQRIHGVVTGAFLGTGDAHLHHTYAKGSSDNWIDGITVLHNAENGDFDLEFLSTERLMEDYG